ncbi:hypothetical protein ACV22V_25545 [Burkholderia sp. AW33-5]
MSNLKPLFLRAGIRLCLSGVLALGHAVTAHAAADDSLAITCSRAPTTSSHSYAPIVIEMGDYLYLPDIPAGTTGALVGRIHKSNPQLTQLAIIFKEATTWDYFPDVAVSAWVSAGGASRSIVVPDSQDVRFPNLPFSAKSAQNRVGADYIVNGMQIASIFMFTQQTANSLGQFVRGPGTQVQDPVARKMVADAFLNQSPMTFGARMFYSPLLDGDRGKQLADWWVKGDSWSLCGYANEYVYGTTVTPSASNMFKLSPISGTISVSNGKMLVSVPPVCRITDGNMECPISTNATATMENVSFVVPPSQQSDIWFMTASGQKVSKVTATALGTSKLVVSANLLDSLLGDAETKPLDDAIGAIVQTTGGTAVDMQVSFFDDTELKRLTFGVAIDERDPAAMGKYSGSIGQDPEIVVPLTIRQYGASKATKVSVDVLAPSVQTADGPRCKFVDQSGATVVAVPSIVRFYDGTGLDDRPDNCTGTVYDVATLKWRETLGGAFAYEGALDMDLRFPLDPKQLATDTTGTPWFGTVSASGEVRVRADWL